MFRKIDLKSCWKYINCAKEMWIFFMHMKIDNIYPNIHLLIFKNNNNDKTFDNFN